MAILIKGGRMAMSFQQLCFSHSVANFIALAFFVFFCAPMIILQSDFSSTTLTGKLLGGFMVSVWDLGVLGLLSNGVAMAILIKGGRMAMSFQQLCFSHSVANFIALAFFVFFCAPMIILQSDFSSTTLTGKLLGGFMVSVWDTGRHFLAIQEPKLPEPKEYRRHDCIGLVSWRAAFHAIPERYTITGIPTIY
ncbi:unnamed protein product [Angiostrongylus costaricensis]|uniref:7TM_GPCR_Srx domain-containing protein n=1 Tax=Angiostrongylus costaricensis TaxID=334426 RepID=A0A0R3Q272_ANGCS|nr:unnamed protein product [Angiostrongylus costaricensis]